MNYASLQYLVMYALWAVALVLTFGAYRCYAVLAGKSRNDGFPAGVQHGPDWYWRLNRAHLNTLENLPIFGSVVIVGVIVGVSSSLFHTCAAVIFYARIAQSLTHIASTAKWPINIRFTFFVIQLAGIVVMGVECLKKICSLS